MNNLYDDFDGFKLISPWQRRNMRTSKDGRSMHWKDVNRGFHL